MKTILNISTKTEVKSYPYGRLRTSAFFSIEFDYKKGFRSVFQTINPKTGKLNKEKKSVYYPIMYNYIEQETQHIKNGALGLGGYDDINKTFAFLRDNQTALQLTDKMLESICLTSIASIKANSAYTRCEKVQLLELLNPAITNLLAMVKEQKYDKLDKIVINAEKIKQLEKEYELQNA